MDSEAELITNSISVLIPVLNGEQFIGQALDSVLVQPLASEILVVDNGSSDGTLEILNNYITKDSRVRVLHCTERGVSKALNVGLALANGSLIARLDADDKMSPERLEYQLRVMQEHPEVALVSSQIIFINSEDIEIGRSNYPSGKLTLLRNFIFRNPVAHPSVMFRKEIVELAGNYRSEFEGAEDLDLWIRILNLGDIFSSEEFLTYYRVHENQVTVKNNLYDTEFTLRLKCLKEFYRGPIKRSIFSILQLMRIVDLLLMRFSAVALLRKSFKARIKR
ncbi:MAG: glycosyltransferase family 2 protein [Candidatus Planktophila sp.]